MGKRKKRQLPEVGTIFGRTYKKHGDVKRRIFELKVVKLGNGIGYEFEGNVFRSPSAAAKSLLHCSVNGWVFWKIDESGKSVRKNSRR